MSTGAVGGALTAGNYGYISATEAQADGTDDDIAAGCIAGAGTATASEGVAQLQRCYPNTWADWTSYDPYSDNYFNGDTAMALPGTSGAGTAMWNHVRGFKGVGPAATEGANNYACTIHTRECAYISAGFCYNTGNNAVDGSITDQTTCVGTSNRAWSYYNEAVDGSGAACEGSNVGSFEVRLNSDSTSARPATPTRRSWSMS
jgi:hypothetical protein